MTKQSQFQWAGKRIISIIIWSEFDNRFWTERNLTAINFHLDFFRNNSGESLCNIPGSDDGHEFLNK